MLHVYLLTEDDFDDQVLLFILEVLLERRCEVSPTKLRRGGGVGEVRRKLPMMAAQIRQAGIQESTCFVVALDNDRHAEHPDHPARLWTAGGASLCRYCELEATVHGQFPDGWPIPGAIAVPVQMIETWLLLLHDPNKYPDEASLPPCAERDRPAARDLFGKNAPPQLKDLLRDEVTRSARGRTDFALACVCSDVIATLAARSPSFALFEAQVRAWRFEGARPG